MTAVGIGHSAASHTRIGSSPDSGVSPNLANSAASLSSPALAVVRSLSPVKIELAPARKHNACVASDMLSRPADRRTIERGMVIRATATVRTNSMSSIFAIGVSASKIGRAAGGERVCTLVEISVVGVSLKKKTHKDNRTQRQ